MSTETEKFVINNKINEIQKQQSQVSIDLEEEPEVLDKNVLESISNMFVYDEVGNRHQIADLWSDFKTIFIFVRVQIKYLNKFEILTLKGSLILFFVNSLIWKSFFSK